jgi:hypothetical protein
MSMSETEKAANQSPSQSLEATVAVGAAVNPPSGPLDEPVDEIDQLMNDLGKITEEFSKAAKPGEPAVLEIKAQGQDAVEAVLAASAEAEAVKKEMDEFRGKEPGTESLSEGSNTEGIPAAGLEETLSLNQAVNPGDSGGLEPMAKVISFGGDSFEGTAGPSGTPGTMTLNVSGSMALKLKYDFDGNEVTVDLSGEFLRVILADGTEFKIPVSKKSRGKQAA